MTNQEINEAVARKLGIWHTRLRPESISSYCTSIAAAWEIVESVKHPMQIGNNCVVKGSEWYCSWWDNANNKSWKEHADTAPMAICLAFLKIGL